MKFIALLLAVVAAQDEEGGEEAAAGCGGGDPCADGECCGTTQPEEGDGVEQCGAADATEVENEDGDLVAFICNPEAEAEEKASSLALGAIAAMGTIAYTMY